MQAGVIDPKVVAKEHKKNFEVSRISRFRYRTRYFTDSGIIGSKEFVADNYQRFKHLFHSKHEKKPKPIKGLNGMYSLKRLSEVIWEIRFNPSFKFLCHNLVGIIVYTTTTYDSIFELDGHNLGTVKPPLKPRGIGHPFEWIVRLSRSSSIFTVLVRMWP